MNPDRMLYRKTVQALSGGRAAVYYPALAPRVGGLKAAVMLSQLIYWNGIRRGWMYKSVEDMQRETGLTKTEQQTARRALAELGLIEVRLKGIPRIWHYRVRLDRLADLMGSPLDENLTHIGKESAPTLGGGSAQLNKVSKITTEIPKYLTREDGTEKGVRSHLTTDGENAVDLDKTAERSKTAAGTGVPANPGDKEPSADNGGADGNGSPGDSRNDHPAIGVVKQVTGRYPPKMVYERVIHELGDNPDPARFARVNEEWLARGYRPTNLAGQLSWYREGIPPVWQGKRAAQTRPPMRIDEPPRTQAEIDILRAKLRALKDRAAEEEKSREGRI